MRIRVVIFPGDGSLDAWWANERASGAVRGIADELDRMLDDPQRFPEAVVSEPEGISFYQAMQEVPGYPEDPYAAIPFEFDTDIEPGD
jgi:hypothetical protein